jgi:hypothetical protein
MCAHAVNNLICLAVDDLDANLRQSPAGSALDDLKILPFWLGTLHRGRSAYPSILWHLSPAFQQCLALTSFAIARHGRRRIRMPATLFELAHQFLGDLLFGFPYGPPNA